MPIATKELESKMYLTQTDGLIDSDSLTHWTHKSGQLVSNELLMSSNL